MRLNRVNLGVLLLLQFVWLLNEPHGSSAAPSPQKEEFQLPVQLIGFPVIVLAVRLSNFVKKLAYAVNPRTYSGRTRRSIRFPDPPLNIHEVEKRLVAELGEHVCVFEKVCDEYAEKARKLHGENHVLNWEEVFEGYERSPITDKRNYLLSVFLGDIVASPGLCHQLAKRGRGCQGRHVSPKRTKSRGTRKHRPREHIHA